MRTALLLVAGLVASALTSTPARAQWYGDNDDNGYGSGYGSGGLVRCESRDGRTERCATQSRDVVLIRQLSSTPCIRGRNWDIDSRGVWVSGGCRAEFRATWNNYDDRYGGGYGDHYGGGYGDLLRCESRNGDVRYCNTNGARAELVRQLSSSPCIRGRSWGSDSRGVWVSQGCRAEFRLDRHGNGGGYGYGNGVVRCESRDNRTRECPLATGRRGDVRLVRQLSSTPCIEGQTWGRTRTGVWVTRGCRAEFVASRGGRPGGAWREPGDFGDQPGGFGQPGPMSQPGQVDRPIRISRADRMRQPGPGGQPGFVSQSGAVNPPGPASQPGVFTDVPGPAPEAQRELLREQSREEAREQGREPRPSMPEAERP